MADTVAEQPEYRQVSYNEKPYAVRVRKTPIGPRTRMGRMVIRNTPVQHCDVGYDGETGEVFFGEDNLTVWDWLELRHRLDNVLIRAGVMELVKPADEVRDTISSSFLTRNWRAIGKHREGTWKRPPWWLRWAYSAVVTKESYDH